MLYENEKKIKTQKVKKTLSEINMEKIKREQKITNPINNSFSKEILKEIIKSVPSSYKHNLINS